MQHLSHLNSVLEALNYGYDANGNRISMNRQSVALPLPNGASNINYNEANQMLSFQPEAQSAKDMTYDENGNLTSIANSCGTTNYTWDVSNRLIGINGFNTDCSTLSASFKYDALWRRTEKTINGKTTQYLYDGLDIVQEIENSVVSANYIRTLNIDEPLARITPNALRYYQTDALGSVIALTDETGAVKTQYSYDPFGAVTITGEASDNPFQYTGRENDGTGLYYYRFRYYSPELQRFISEDPIRLYGGKNFFVYVSNNPTLYIDPLGLKCWTTYNKYVVGYEYREIITSNPPIVTVPQKSVLWLLKQRLPYYYIVITTTCYDECDGTSSTDEETDFQKGEWETYELCFKRYTIGSVIIGDILGEGWKCRSL